MDSIQIIGFTLLALLLVVSPGPNGLLIAKTVPFSGKNAGFANVAGFLAAFYLHGSLAILGISVLLMKSSEAFMLVKIIGAIYLCWIGLKSLFGAVKEINTTTAEQPIVSQKTLLKSFLEGFLTNALNPKVSMFYLAAFPQFIPTGDAAIAYGFLLVTIHSAMNMLWFSGMVILFSKLAGAAQHPLMQRLLKGITGIVFIGFGAKLMTLESR
jgi:threonine/homoserine/homoserine lactone efflux protein